MTLTGIGDVWVSDLTFKLNRWSRSFKWELNILQDNDYNPPNAEIMPATNPSMIYSLMAGDALT